MPLDPQFQPFLDLMVGAPKMRDLPLEALRQGGAAPVQGPPVAIVHDIEIPTDTGAIGPRHYRPAAAPVLPLILYFHGGGFVICDLESHDAICRELCVGTGAAVISVDYRLAPEHPFPAATDDALAALRWVAGQAAALGIDAGRIAVAGDSAGGNLAAVTALRARDAGGPAIAGQLLIYPVTDHPTGDTESIRQFAEGPFLTLDDMMWFTELYVGPTERTHPHAFPLRADDLANLPPAFILTAEMDPLRDEGEAYGERLRAAGVACDIIRYPGAIHAFFGIPGTDVGRRAQHDAIIWLKRILA